MIAATPQSAPATVALTEQPEPVHEESFFSPSSPEFWVYVSITIFLLYGLFVLKAPARIAKALDARIAETRRELDEAKALRTEAERLLAEAQAQQAASANDAAAILAHAETEARDLIADAERDAEQLVQRRGRMAEDKIGAAERAAIADIRARAARAAASAAEALIRDRHDGTADKALVDKTIAGLGHAG